MTIIDRDMNAILARVEEIKAQDDSDFTGLQKLDIIIELCGLCIMSFCIFFVRLAKKVREWWKE